MKTITICGSMKFEAEMQDIAFQLETKHRFNVLQCVCSAGRAALTAQELDALKRAHCRKIDLSDGIYVVDLQGYIGASVWEEIEYAQQRGKQVLLHSAFGL